MGLVEINQRFHLHSRVANSLVLVSGGIAAGIIWTSFPKAHITAAFWPQLSTKRIKWGTS